MRCSGVPTSLQPSCGKSERHARIAGSFRFVMTSYCFTRKTSHHSRRSGILCRLLKKFCPDTRIQTTTHAVLGSRFLRTHKKVTLLRHSFTRWLHQMGNAMIRHVAHAGVTTRKRWKTRLPQETFGSDQTEMACLASSDS